MLEKGLYPDKGEVMIADGVVAKVVGVENVNMGMKKYTLITL